ncbi:CRISPR-associated endonuclease Cas2 [Candidatus Berkelbacteria bacterium CG08_land_8_20_14_0_20_39_8]|uniref:CRISPR-associated endonuclease Cas2 n=1 Tax=Candidatus Berkelbacteria bacterium CG08_land_8_20_14_0_20_39_8 TaxID=1974511 RepID=A0A2M6YD49_9BACT|nr:MAG: CRISPR-associated endonuclease Cas2 [Candidatus Berkelbacteria bacterium CG08_land_8_20_14_0_20_39_8]
MYIEITKKGFSRVNQVDFSEVKILRNKKWDGDWWVVIYDLPRKYNPDKNRLRKILVRSGFVKVQESVYVYPFKCVDEVDRILDHSGISHYVLIMESKVIRNEELLIKKFVDSKVLSPCDLK